LLRFPQTTQSQRIRALYLVAAPLLAVVILTFLQILVEGRYLLPLWLPVGLGVGYALSSPSARLVGLGLAGLLVCIWVGAGAVGLAVPKFGARDDTLGAARSLGVAANDRLIAINQPWDVVPFEEYRPHSTADAHRVVRVRELDVVAMPLTGEPPPSEHQRPSSLGAGVLPKGLRLAEVIRGSTYLVERFIASTPVSMRVDGHGNAFTAGRWRFLNEPAGGRMGGL
jgi:hypothetical protein